MLLFSLAQLQTHSMASDACCTLTQAGFFHTIINIEERRQSNDPTDPVCWVINPCQSELYLVDLHFRKGYHVLDTKT